jgi:UDP-N-acetylmuramoyl-L-alanyl-D-glutamate--2,6-diaminopimelate ligase
MKLLSDIVYKAGIEEVAGSMHLAISSIAFDSRKADRLGLFIAVKGIGNDGHDFIEKAIEAGCCAIVCEVMPNELKDGITYIKVRSSSFALGIIASNFFGNPSQKLKVIGITGTNGKTTTVTLLYQLFKYLGFQCGLLSTVRYMVGDEEISSTHTTPDPITIHQLMSRMVEGGCTYCCMEVSSHAVVQDRIAGIEFAVAGFTNITHDHLDYHQTFQNYLDAKKGFFDGLGSVANAILNRDDRHSSYLVQNSKAKVHTYGLKMAADFKAKIIETHIAGNLLNIEGTEVWTKLSGNFNVYNLLLVYSAAILCGQDRHQVLTAISLLQPVEGRFQLIKSEAGITGIVDYAHTPDALENVLKTIQELRTGNEKLITIIGCGGDRDKAKRPLMAAIACKFSTQVILTSDNPRSEDPEEILKEMMSGVEVPFKNKTLSITERRQAIKTAAMLAAKGDIILLAGKGHEKYQEIKGIKHPFDDLEEITEILKEIKTI